MSKKTEYGKGAWRRTKGEGVTVGNYLSIVEGVLIMNCTHKDCFTCPYADCIMDIAPGKAARKRGKLTDEEKKIRKAEANKKYYAKNQSRYQQLHRDYYRKKKGIEK